MSTDWDIQRLSLVMRTTEAQEREVILRPLARLIARRLKAEGLAKQENEDKTMIPERQEAAA